MTTPCCAIEKKDASCNRHVRIRVAMVNKAMKL